MKEYNAEIKIESHQENEEGTESFSQSLPCKFMYKGRKAYILYRSEGITSKIHAECGKVIITRMGEFSSEMIYGNGEEQAFFYRTPYGEIEMKLLTESVFVELDDSGGKIELKYKLLFSGNENKNRVVIFVRRENTDEN